MYVIAKIFCSNCQMEPMLYFLFLKYSEKLKLLCAIHFFGGTVGSFQETNGQPLKSTIGKVSSDT